MHCSTTVATVDVFRRWSGRVWVALLLGIGSACARTSRVELPDTMAPAAAAVSAQWIAGLDSLHHALAQLDTAAQRWHGDATIADVQQTFVNARVWFKRGEFLTAYYQPTTTESINGPALWQADWEEGPEVVTAPEGFQVIEELLYGEPSDASRAKVREEIRNVRSVVTRLRTAAEHQRLTDAHIFDAAKLEIARVVSLGISGFDSPIANLSLGEARASLHGVHEALRVYGVHGSAATRARIDATFAHADSLLASAPSFDAFNRLAFVVQAANPISRVLADARTEGHIGIPTETRAFRLDAVSFFDRDAFDASAFAAPDIPAATREQIALGRALFFEPALSLDGQRTCATCHDPARAFTDGQKRSGSRSGHAVLRNSPTLLNSGLQVGSFADLRATYLEDQITDVLLNTEEMRGDTSTLIARLATRADYPRQFAAAFPASTTPPDAALSARNVRRALASYLRSLTSLESRVDHALRGDTLALDADERAGFTLFMGKAKCGTCHFAPLFNGTVPPIYQESEVEVIGVPRTTVTRGAMVDPDSGRFRVTRAPLHLHAFRTPTVRNVALTAPYMHNGRLA
ncbi:MAG: hypothetical protein IT353_16670, partial [Gemmatimonadaceae bacterium]|nr:hypothetical protein [Gemmatimonadaceae bacterium]